MLANSVHHLSFTVTDLERSRAFYEGIMGLETVPRPEFGIDGVWYSAGNAQIHLIELTGREKPDTKLSPLANHNAFAIDDYQKILDQLKNHGVEVLETTPEQGQMWISDPDGNIIELIAPGTMR
ncbi:MAG: VOC family protein [Myxococcota bacterium]